MQRIDLHTHQIKKDRSIQILNIFAQDLPIPNSESFFSTGLHPWHIESVNPEKCLQLIDEAAKTSNILAIGECGLDRSISVSLTLQYHYFIEQIKIAEKYKKPVIIHCVRAYSDLINIKKQSKSKLPWIIHDYSGNKETTQNLINHGFYFSIGKQLVMHKSKHDILRMIPTERLFLETDNTELPIKNIYILTAQILKIDEELLTEITFTNFKRLFENGKMGTTN